MIWDIPAESVYPHQDGWMETHPHLVDVTFALEIADKGKKRKRVLATGDLQDIVQELSKGWSDKWLQYFEEGVYSDSTLGEWLQKYREGFKISLRVVKTRKLIKA